jgi:hypothetical protein
MKLTTKIMLCLLIAIFGLSLAFIVGFSRSERTHYNEYSTKHYSISQDSMATVETGKFRVVRIEDDDFDNFYMNGDNCSFRLIPASVGASCTLPLQIPESIKNCIDVSNSGDTLVVNIRMRDVLQNIESKRNNFVSGLNLTLAAEKVDIINNFHRLKTIVEKFDADTIFIRHANYVSIRSCSAKVVDYETVDILHIWDSRIGTVNVDFDKTDNYESTNSEIDVENLTGRGYRDLRNITAKTLNWTPKTKDAKLYLLIEGDTASINFKK